MNHRKSEHPTNKVCRYFLLSQCKFDENVCWYSHEDKPKSQSENACNECDENFTKKNDLMKHKKMTHKKNVQRCRKYLQGNCSFEEAACWYSHEVIAKKEAFEKNEETEKVQEGFHEAKKRTPPDHMENIYSIITQLSNQVAQMMKNTATQSQ